MSHFSRPKVKLLVIFPTPFRKSRLSFSTRFELMHSFMLNKIYQKFQLNNCIEIVIKATCFNAHYVSALDPLPHKWRFT
jgi:hypothetical protein